MSDGGQHEMLARLARVDADTPKRPAGLDDQEILFEAAAIVRRFMADPSSPLAAALTSIAFGERPDDA